MRGSEARQQGGVARRGSQAGQPGGAAGHTAATKPGAPGYPACYPTSLPRLLPRLANPPATPPGYPACNPALPPLATLQGAGELVDARLPPRIYAQMHTHARAYICTHM